MNNKLKLILSDEERQLVNNTGWILTKHDIIRKVYGMFGELSEKYKAALQNEFLPPSIMQASAKISKGENYRQLPYVMLDYPRCFDAGNIFAFRTMFWWGHFFSITLHLSGKYKNTFEKNLCAGLELLKQDNVYLCVNEDPWQHHFEADNYRPANQFTRSEFENAMAGKQFVKLAAKFPLTDWSEMPEMLEAKYLSMLQALKFNFPDGETVLLPGIPITGSGL